MVVRRKSSGEGSDIPSGEDVAKVDLIDIFRLDTSTLNGAWI